jgi:hypothetical protein
MAANDLTFVIPTYRLRGVGETVERCNEHFWRNGHEVRMTAFQNDRHGLPQVKVAHHKKR